MAENGTIITNKGRGPYKKLERLHVCHQIERLLLDGFSGSFIRQKLGLSERTYNRYRQQTFLEQKECLLGLGVDFAMEQLIECDKKFKMLEDVAIKIAQDSSTESNARVAAVGTAAEIVKQRIILLNNGPELITRLRGYPKSAERFVAILARKNHLRLPKQLLLQQQQKEEEGGGK